MTIQEFIKSRPYLIWYVADLEQLSEESVVEHVLNYGDFDDVQELISILGIQKTAQIFRAQTENHHRINYRREIKNYFTLYFQKHAPRDTDSKSNQISALA